MAHSYLGASGAHRWMNCSGSVTPAAEFASNDDSGGSSAYAAEGTAAHMMASECLENGYNSDECKSHIYNGYFGNKLDLDAVQTYVGYCRSLIHAGDEVFIEHLIGEKEGGRPHPAFFGTVDFAVLQRENPNKSLKIVDFKYGMGIYVDPVDNPQTLYYAFGLLLDLEDIDDDMPVEVTIVQPRMEWADPIRTWTTTAGHVLEWGRTVLLPKMRAADRDTAFSAGDWCRFCPAKLACPLLKGMFQVAATINTKWLVEAPSDVLGQEYTQIEPVKMYLKAVETEAYNRLMAGKDVAGAKLVDKKASRIWKDGALETLSMILGPEAMTEPQLKSPAELSKVSSASGLVAEWAYTPKTGYTVALASDRRPVVKVETPAETFSEFLKAGIGEEANG